ncbi:MAG: DoxX family protein [Myxococcales bacterium]|nr:DoxX family protein [Myxococcales bacterium]
MQNTLRKLMTTRAPAAVLLVRIAVGAVFLSEGIQKFLFPAALGVGRMAKIGIPWPQVMGPFVGAVEIICGGLVLFGLLTRLAAVPLAVTMGVALVSTKIPILLGHAYWGLRLRSLPSYGFWRMAHESRTDLAMLLCALFLLVLGAGRWSLDARIAGGR